MARPPACCSLCWNPPLIGKDGLASPALTEGSGTPTPTPVVFCAPTPAPATAPAFALSTDNELFKQFIKAYLEAQVPGQKEVDPEPRKQPPKDQFPDLYYANLHMDYYQFCQQYEDHFITAGTKRSNRILFAALFLHRSVTQQWLQHK